MTGSVKEIKFSEAAFSSLVLPAEHKELILALTESQACNKETFDDVIQGKGVRFSVSFLNFSWSLGNL